MNFYTKQDFEVTTQALIDSLNTLKSNVPDLDLTVSGDKDKVVVNGITITGDDIQRYYEHARPDRNGCMYGELDTARGSLRLGDTFINLRPGEKQPLQFDTMSIPLDIGLRGLIESLSRKLPPTTGTFKMEFSSPDVTDRILQAQYEYKERLKKLISIHDSLEENSTGQMLFCAYCAMIGYPVKAEHTLNRESLFTGPDSGLQSINQPEVEQAMLIEFILRNNDRFDRRDLNTFIIEAFRAVNICRLTYSYRRLVPYYIDTTEDHVFRVFAVHKGKVINYLRWKQNTNGFTIERATE